MFKSKITSKIFVYTISLLILNFLIISLLSDFFIENYTARNQRKYLTDTYATILQNDPSSKEFKDTIKALQHENMYIICYDREENNVFYSTPSINYNIQTEDIDLLINYIKDADYDYLIANPTSEFTDTIYKITGRQLQITLFGKYISKDSNLYVILQMPYQQIIDIAKTNQRFLIVSSLIVALMSIGPTIAFTYFFSKPLKEAIKMAKSIKAQDFSQRCIIRTKDEIADLEEAMNMMADSINVYTSELETSNQMLKQDIENRKKIEKAQKEFISNASHEIKTPISIISGYAEGLKCGLATNDEEREEYCDIIIDECDRMTNIIMELLNLSKLENGTIELDYSNFNINELCELIISKFKYKCQAINCKIKIEADGESIVRADYNEIEKVLINYFQNAYKHVSENGTISFIIRKESPYIYIGVNNDGNNIPENEIDKIWDKFYKIDKSHKREENSTGLGLSIVKATMNLHKMPYGVKNTPNGVEFFIKLQEIAES